LRTIVAQGLERYRTEPLHVRTHPDEVARLEGAGIPVIADDSLRTGDVVLETRYGSIDASLGIRLERLLNGFRA
jgi:flagellar biosynthesis/type III secretory pathway protein FliH